MHPISRPCFCGPRSPINGWARSGPRRRPTIWGTWPPNLSAPYLPMLLEVDHVCKRFGGVLALDRCSFSVPEGAVMGLIGPNGSGKTTLFDLVTGFGRPDSGRVTFRSRPIAGLRPDRVSRLGIGRTFQLARTFPRLTVLENLLVATGGRGAWG